MDSALYHPRIFFAHSFINSSYRSPRFATTCWRLDDGSRRVIKASGNSDGNVFDESPLRGTDGSLFDSASFKTVDAKITPETDDFFVSDAEGDPDCPTEGYSSVELALQALRKGKVCSLGYS